MKYTKFTPEENEKLNRIWGGGHTGAYELSILTYL